MARVMSDATTPPPGAGPLSHIDDDGAAHMVDVTEKAATKRTAVAAGSLRTARDICCGSAVGHGFGHETPRNRCVRAGRSETGWTAKLG